jgi:hypothetical protein
LLGKLPAEKKMRNRDLLGKLPAEKKIWFFITNVYYVVVNNRIRNDFFGKLGKFFVYQTTKALLLMISLVDRNSNISRYSIIDTH